MVNNRMTSRPATFTRARVSSSGRESVCCGVEGRAGRQAGGVPFLFCPLKVEGVVKAGTVCSWTPNTDGIHGLGQRIAYS